MENPKLTSREQAKLDKLTASWKKSAMKQVPPGMVIDGIVSGGKGIPHRKLIYGGIPLSFVCAMLLGNILQLFHLPLLLIFPIILIVLNLAVHLIGELGIYRSTSCKMFSSRERRMTTPDHQGIRNLHTQWNKKESSMGSQIF